MTEENNIEMVPLTHDEIMFLRSALSLHCVEPEDRAVFNVLNRKVRGWIKHGFKVKDETSND